MIKYKKMILTQYSCNDYNSFRRRSLARFTEVNNKGYSGSEWPIRGRLQRYQLFYSRLMTFVLKGILFFSKRLRIGQYIFKDMKKVSIKDKLYQNLTHSLPWTPSSRLLEASTVSIILVRVLCTALRARTVRFVRASTRVKSTTAAVISMAVITAWAIPIVVTSSLLKTNISLHILHTVLYKFLSCSPNMPSGLSRQ